MNRVLYIGNFLGNQTGFYAGPNQWIVDQLIKLKYDVKYTSTKLSKVSRLFDFFKLIFNERKNTQLALIDTYSTQAFYFALFASWLCVQCKIKFILVLHGGNLPQRFATSPKLVRWMYTHALHIVAPSAYLQQKSVEVNLPTPIIIANPIELHKYNFKLRENLQPNILWVRSLQTIYNPSMALSVVEKLKKKYPYVFLTMIGPDKENLLPTMQLEAKEKDIVKNIEFTGKLSLQEWTKKSTQSSIFINTTHIDNTPVSVLEAMALGLVVVSTNVGGISYILQDKVDALLCNDNDVDAMCIAIEQLLSNEKMANDISLNARKKIEQLYSSENVLNAWLSLINNSLN